MPYSIQIIPQPLENLNSTYKFVAHPFEFLYLTPRDQCAIFLSDFIPSIIATSDLEPHGNGLGGTYAEAPGPSGMEGRFIFGLCASCGFPCSIHFRNFL